MSWLWFVAIALGAPVELPPGELSSTWGPTLSEAGLEPRPVGPGAGVLALLPLTALACCGLRTTARAVYEAMTADLTN